MSLILNRPAPLFLGAWEDSLQAGIAFSRVLSAVSSRRQTPIGSGSFSLPSAWAGLAFHHVPLSDCVHTDLLRGLDAAVEFLLGGSASALAAAAAAAAAAAPSGTTGGSTPPTPPDATLVHCLGGVSRSASVMLGYFLLAAGLPLSDGAALLRALRPCVCPNAGFLTQLHLLERVLRPPPSTRPLDDDDCGAPAPAAASWPAAAAAPAPLLRLLAIASARAESGRPVDGFDEHAQGVFVTCPAWAPRELSGEQVAALQAAVEGALAAAARHGAPPESVARRLWAAPPGAAPAAAAASAAAAADGGGGDPPAEAAYWYDCGRCNAHVFHSANVILPPGAARVVSEGKQRPSPRQQPPQQERWGGGRASSSPSPPPPHEELAGALAAGGGGGGGEAAGGGGAFLLLEPLAWMAAAVAVGSGPGSGSGSQPPQPPAVARRGSRGAEYGATVLSQRRAAAAGAAQGGGASAAPATAACGGGGGGDGGGGGGVDGEEGHPAPPAAAAAAAPPAAPGGGVACHHLLPPTPDEAADSLLPCDGGKLACYSCGHRLGAWSWHCTLELLAPAGAGAPATRQLTSPAFRVEAARTIRRPAVRW